METKNVYQKLNEARLRFLQGGVAKSGKNFAIQFSYFELSDIVPAATQIFNEVGLLTVVKYCEESATMYVINTDKPDEVITFCTPMRYAPENKGVNPLQALGATQTYIRRYLYMAALDIVEADAVDCDTAPVPVKAEEPAPAEPAKPVSAPAKRERKSRSKPATAEERKEAKEQLTSVAMSEQATDLSIEMLQQVCAQLLEKDPEQEDFIGQIATMTEGFKTVTQEQCDALVDGIADMLRNYNG